MFNHEAVINIGYQNKFLKEFKRKFAGETFFMTEFTPNGDGFVPFAGNTPGRIKAIELKGNEFLARRLLRWKRY